MKNTLKATALVAALVALTVLPAAAADQIVIPGQDDPQPKNILEDMIRNSRGQLFHVVFVDTNSNGTYDAGIDNVLEMDLIDWTN